MEPRKETAILDWRKIVDLGSGSTGSVALFIEQICTEDKTCGENHQRIFHAVKRVPRKCTNSGAVRRIMQEKKALEMLKGHHGIVELRFTSKDDDSLYFVLEPLLGGPLHRHIRAGPMGRLEVSAAIFYSSEVTSAIAHMHSHGLIHRDIKASNIVLGASGHAKLVDMGCCKELKRLGTDVTGDVGTARNHSYEKTDTYCGTPHCMAPEMVLRSGHGQAVDWWALGILVHEMLHGEPPFGYKADDLAQKITAGLPVDTRCNGGASVKTIGDPVRCHVLRRRRLLDTDPEKRLGSSRGADEVMCHEWFQEVSWERTAKLETEPPAFRRDLGELEYADEDIDRDDGSVPDVDPDGLFAGF
ncbi:unnamed protein product [Hapterophycus canaliculatus]